MPADSSCPTFRVRVVAAVLLNLLLVYSSTTGAFAASQSGTTMPTAALIEDSVGNIWTPANNIFYINGIPITGKITTLLLYYNNTIYASNSDGNWYLWNNGWQSTAGDPRGGNGAGGGSASPNGTTIPTASQIVDGGGNVWTRSGGSFHVNGTSVTSSITILLLYFNNTIYANNSDGNWYRWNNGWFYVASDPRGTDTTTDNANNAIDLTGYTLTFNDEFTGQTISDSLAYNGAKWYTHNEQCCMATTDGSTTAMVGLSDRLGTFSLIPGGGLRIRLQKINNHWTSGVLTSVDNSGIGFSQQYGYFEIEAAFPNGYDTWPAFWMLNTAAKAHGAPAGEVDIVEYIANPGFINWIRSTIHDWSDNSVPAWSANPVSPEPSDGNYHTYGLLWTPQTVTFYYDRQVMLQAATPAVMQQPYYLIVDLGIGAGWPTEATPPVNDMLVKHIRAYALPAR